MRAVLLLLALGGCDYMFQLDRVSLGDARAGSDDGGAGDGGAGGDGSSTIDGPPQTSACDPASVAQVYSDTGLTEASQSPDGLELYVSRWENNDFNLYRLTRATPSSPYSLPVKDTELSSTNNDEDPAVVKSGTMILFMSTRSGSRQLFQATRGAPSEAFSSPIMIGTSGAVVGGMDVSPDGLTLWADDGVTALRKLTRTTDTGNFGGAGTLFNNVRYPSLTGNQLTVYYEHAGTIYRATRASTTGGFGNPQTVIAGHHPDISEDGTTLLFQNADGIAKINCN